MRATKLHYDSEGAVKASAADYRDSITADDSVDLSAVLGDAPLQSTEGRQAIAVSLRFDDAGDSADIYVVAWGRDAAGNNFALGWQNATGVGAGALREGAAAPYLSKTQFFDACGAHFFEVRLLNTTVAGTGIKIRAWTF